jgi:hypothetical protein
MYRLDTAYCVGDERGQLIHSGCIIDEDLARLCYAGRFPAAIPESGTRGIPISVGQVMASARAAIEPAGSQPAVEADVIERNQLERLARRRWVVGLASRINK